MGFSSSQPLKMKTLLAIAFLFAGAESRRHLCDDGKRPVCADGTRAVYNRPTGKNTDGSEPSVKFNTCTEDEKKCPTGQGFGAGDKPRPACADGSKCVCPGGGKNCQFRYKVCANRKSCVTQ